MSWLPGIPTFDFVILAAFFFARSSDRFHTWLVGHPFFGKIIAGYRGGGFTIRAKAWISVALVTSLAFSIVVLADSTVLRLVLGVVGVIALWFIWTRPTRVVDDRRLPRAPSPSLRSGTPPAPAGGEDGS
jgi:uncharacterized membrane protein YbaN (DUF454 family)